MFTDIDEIKKFVRDKNSQSHLCICNTDLFEGSIFNGIYGFPHQGSSKTKSFWRAVASMYNIGPHDLIFIYRTNGDVEGCKEIHGPFKIKEIIGSPTIYYDQDSSHYPMKIKNPKKKKEETDCTIRFLFEKVSTLCRSLSDNYELIKKFESKEIWGYRHPAVMNIGAARKKSVTSFTNKQTLLLLDMLKTYGTNRYEITASIPLDTHLQYYNFSNTSKNYKLDDEFLISSNSNDEAFLYAYILRGLKTRNSIISKNLIDDLNNVNASMIDIPFEQISINAMLEVIISPHLQDELDIVLMDKDDSRMLFLELKTGIIDQAAINQTAKYLDLLTAIFPTRKVYANIIGSGKDASTTIPTSFSNRINIVKYNRTQNGFIRFQKA